MKRKIIFDEEVGVFVCVVRTINLAMRSVARNEGTNNLLVPAMDCTTG